VAYCNSVYDEFLEITDASRRVEFEAVRSVAVKAMVDCATLHLLFSFITRLEDMVEDAVEDSYVVGKGLAVASVAKYLTNTEHREFTADARPAIEQAVQRAAEKRRKVIRTHFKGLPSLLSERGRGAPIKPQSVRARERDAYAAKVEVAYRKIRNLTGKKPTKISVAKELGEGGLNLKSGIDSSAAAFRNKLTRLGIDYDAIKARIEAETKQ
jgi:hypothetical protein